MKKKENKVRYNKEKFFNLMNKLQKQTEKEDAINDILSLDFFDASCLSEAYFSDIINLLTAMYDDENEYIWYYVTDLNFGKNYYDGMIQDKDNHNIRLANLDDLWSLIN